MNRPMTASSRDVLIVDDDVYVVKALERVLRPYPGKSSFRLHSSDPLSDGAKGVCGKLSGSKTARTRALGSLPLCLIRWPREKSIRQQRSLWSQDRPPAVAMVNRA